MNRMCSNVCSAWLFGLAVASSGYSAAIQAGDCWLDIYDEPGLQGNKVHIQGPRDLPNLRSLEGANWADRIDSVQVGPKAQVYAYRQEEFRDDFSGLGNHGDAIKTWNEDARTFSEREISFGAGHREHHLGELNFHRNINSLKVQCIP